MEVDGLERELFSDEERKNATEKVIELIQEEFPKNSLKFLNVETVTKKLLYFSHSLSDNDPDKHFFKVPKRDSFGRILV